MSPVSGRIVEVKRSKTNSGQVFGGVVKIIDRGGRVFVFRHVDPRKLKVGQRVDAGSLIASVTPWRDGSPHAHIEVWKTLKGGYRFENMIDPALLFD
jgi:murein DD-endopeptidase MepM/ murein hydrolase activator NlpD